MELMNKSVYTNKLEGQANKDMQLLKMVKLFVKYKVKINIK